MEDKLIESGHTLAIKENTKAIERLEQSQMQKNKIELMVIVWLYLATFYAMFIVWQIMKFNLVSKLFRAFACGG